LIDISYLLLLHDVNFGLIADYKLRTNHYGSPTYVDDKKVMASNLKRKFVRTFYQKVSEYFTTFVCCDVKLLLKKN